MSTSEELVNAVNVEAVLDGPIPKKNTKYIITWIKTHIFDIYLGR